MVVNRYGLYQIESGINGKRKFYPLATWEMDQGAYDGSNYDWSLDGQRVLRSDRSDIWATTANGMSQHLTTGYHPRWSHNGEYIAFLRDLNLYVMKVEPASS